MKRKVMLFYSNIWCKSSKKMSDIFGDLSKSDKYKSIDFEKVDVDTEYGTELSCKYLVKNVPIMIAVEKGKEVDRLKGLHKKEEIRNFLDKWK